MLRIRHRAMGKGFATYVECRVMWRSSAERMVMEEEVVEGRWEEGVVEVEAEEVVVEM